MQFGRSDLNMEFRKLGTGFANADGKNSTMTGSLWLITIFLFPDVFRHMSWVKNINGVLHSPCACGSWLAHWKKFSGFSHLSYFCTEKNCLRTDLTGAFVQKAESSDANWYVVPLCSVHSLHKGMIELMEHCVLVSVDKRETCGEYPPDK